MKFTLTIESSNEALNSEDGLGYFELHRLLVKVANQVEDGYTQRNVLDYNGHVVGEWEYVK